MIFGEDIGRIAYETYCEAVGWKSVKGDDLPNWSTLVGTKPTIAYAWRAAADAVYKKAAADRLANG